MKVKHTIWKNCKKVAMNESISEDRLGGIWLQAVDKIAPDGDEDNMTLKFWKRVEKLVIKKLRLGEEK